MAWIARIILSALSMLIPHQSEPVVYTEGVIHFDYVLVEEVVPEPPRVSATQIQPSEEFTYGIEQWRDLMTATFGDNVEYALRIIQCESQGNAFAHNFNPNTGDDSVGLFQINIRGNLLPGRMAILQSLGHNAVDRESTIALLKRPEVNAAVAYQMSAGGYSWEPWTCSAY